MKKLCFILFIFTLLVSACTKAPYQENNDDVAKNNIQSIIELDSKKDEPAEELMVNFLNKLYTITDPQEYERELAEMFEDAAEGKENFLGYEEFCSAIGKFSLSASCQED